MSDKDAATPRVFLMRHGETEWSKNGRFTGITDLPLLPIGESKVRQTAACVFGPNRLVDPTKLSKIYCSPRQRAQQTLSLLLQQLPDSSSTERLIETTSAIAEWGYGDYEGLKKHEIRDLRSQRGHDTDRPWDIWRDGTEGPGSESPQQVAERLDLLIEEITKTQARVLTESSKEKDMLVVAHGHILRAFVRRWLRLPMDTNLELMLEPGGLCGLSYAHGNIDERALLVGMSFPS